jgi:ribosome-associated protein
VIPIPDTDAELLAQCVVETFRAGGPGGQHQNVTDSAVRLRHTPSGIVVTCRSRRSQHANKSECLRRLRLRLERLNTPRRPRVATRPSKAAKDRRLAEKARRSQIKRDRSAPGDD